MIKCSGGTKEYDRYLYLHGVITSELEIIEHTNLIYGTVSPQCQFLPVFLGNTQTTDTAHQRTPPPSFGIVACHASAYGILIASRRSQGRAGTFLL